MKKTDLMHYSANDGSSSIKLLVKNESVWATEKIIADIFNSTVGIVSQALEDIFLEKELKKELVHTQYSNNNGAMFSIYNIDAIISVGYRINGGKATKFRIWATESLKQYLKYRRDGFLIDEERLAEDPKALNELAAKIRELRDNEKNIYASVRECFKLAASDYEPSSKEVRSFYALLQDKFHYAVTKMTATKLKLDRANHTEDKMGVVHCKRPIPTLKEALVAKNYLKEEEMYRLHLLSEQFLLYAEATAMRGASMTMAQLNKQLDNLLILNGYHLLEGYTDYIKEKADAFVEKEHKAYVEIKKLEYLDIKVDLELFYEGEYKEYKEQTNQIRLQDINKYLEAKDIESFLEIKHDGDNQNNLLF